GLQAAGVDLHDLAADHALADDLHRGVGPNEMAQLAVKPQTHEDVASRRGRRLHGDDLAGLDALDADARADLDAADLPEAGANVEGVAPQPLPAAHGEQAGAGQSQSQQDDDAQQDRLPT